MKATVKKKWLKALRSGEYAQTTGRLRARGGYCCLGVVCEAGLSLTPELKPGTTTTYTYDGAVDMLSPEQEGKLGIDRNTSVRLARLNDTGYSFSWIADYIEENL